MQPRDLTIVLKGATPGEWAAVSTDLTRLIAHGSTPEEARTKARNSGETEFVVLQVPLPNVGIAATAHT